MILSRNWDFIISLKSDRNISNENGNWNRISTYFKDGRRSWTTFRIKADGVKTKWHSYATKQLEGHLKGVFKKIKLICSKRTDGKILYLACSNLHVCIKDILQCYKLRWTIEIFHRSIKSNLGLEDSGAHKFDTLNTHIHWVYCAYIFINELVREDNIGIKEKQNILKSKIEIGKIKKIIQKTTQYSGLFKVKAYCNESIEEIHRIHKVS